MKSSPRWLALGNMGNIMLNRISEGKGGKQLKRLFTFGAIKCQRLNIVGRSKQLLYKQQMKGTHFMNVKTRAT